MKTQRAFALRGILTPEMRIAARREKVSPEVILHGLKKGTIALVKNNRRDIPPMAIGKGMTTKVNANIGTSQYINDLDQEIAKLALCEKHGAEAVMDLSTGGDLDAIRKLLLSKTKLAFGTVPIYQLMCEKKSEFSAKDILDIIRKHCEQGVDFITVHCGVTKEVVSLIEKNPRVTGVVSRGGSFLAKWIQKTGMENPLYTHFDELCNIAYEYDVTLSLGDGLRPGCLADAHDKAQIKELEILGKLTKRAWKKGVQVMVEGPGHVPYDQIAYSMKLQKKLCFGAPFYVLGPLTTDIAPGYDHITGAIGGTLAAIAGADFLCYVTPAEHLGYLIYKMSVTALLPAKSRRTVLILLRYQRLVNATSLWPKPARPLTGISNMPSRLILTKPALYAQPKVLTSKSAPCAGICAQCGISKPLQSRIA